MKRIFVVFFPLFAVQALCGGLVRVPQDFQTIQAAIDASASGDTVLVAEGTYFENIIFKGKSVVVTSTYCRTGDVQTIAKTVIDGSHFASQQAASTVRFLNGEDSAAVIQGFTITGGWGTKYQFSSGLTAIYQEGGGIILDHSSATIRDNIIVGNCTRAAAGYNNGGGGGIATMYGNPTICNNVIVSNTAAYAAGIVLNFSGGKIRNNILYHNYGGASFGTAGIMIWKTPGKQTLVENNTIIANLSSRDAGGISITLDGDAPTVRNNIVWRNRQVGSGQVTNPNLAAYNLIEDYAGGTNISLDPALADSSFLPGEGSPCVDRGDTAACCRDREQSGHPGVALFPSLGSARSDIGASGGPLAKVLPSVQVNDLYLSASQLSIRCAAGVTVRSAIELLNLSSRNVIIDSIVIPSGISAMAADFRNRTMHQMESDSLIILSTPVAPGNSVDTVKVYHHVPGVTSPLRVVLAIRATATTGAGETGASFPREFHLSQNFPNPFNPTTTISFEIPSASRTSLVLYDLLGSEVQRIVEGIQEPGRHEVHVSARGLASGTYFYRMEANPVEGGQSYSAVRKLTVLK